MELVLGLAGIFTSVITFMIGYLISKNVSEKHFKIYKEVNRSDSDFVNDLKKSKEVKFIGTTHPKLYKFIEEIFSDNNQLNELNILYSSDIENKLLEKDKSQVFSSIHDISKVLGNSNYKKYISDNLLTNIFQLTQFTSFCGCIINNETIYITHFSPHNDRFGTDGMTIRVRKTPTISATNTLFDEYEAIFDKFALSSIPILKMYSSKWDDSVDAWKKFAHEESPYMLSIKHLLESITPQDGDLILELGCGTGNLAEALLRKHPNVKRIVLADSSGQMLDYCAKRFSCEAKIAIRYFNPYETNKIGFKYIIGQNYSYVLSHLSFPFPEDSKSEFSEFAENIAQSINVGGKLIITIHNVVVGISGDNYDRKTDCFINDMIGLFKHYYGRRVIKQLLRTKYSEDEFKDIFCKEMLFKCENFREESYHFTMIDRIKMWQVPAILSTLIDLNIANDTDINTNIFVDLQQKYLNKKTEDIKTKTFIFERV